MHILLGYNALMIPVTYMSEEELDQAALQMARAFNEHQSRGNAGIFPALGLSIERVQKYMKAMLRYGIVTGELHVTSERGEGYAVWSDSRTEKNPFFAAMRMTMEVIAALGIDGFAQYTAMFSTASGTQERQLKHRNSPYLSVSLLAVVPEYQHQGYMRVMMEDIFREADEKGIPVVLQTDTEDKKDRYCRIGMICTGKRPMGFGVTYYDLIRYPGGKKPSESAL